jgi:hypothetical protein
MSKPIGSPAPIAIPVSAPPKVTPSKPARRKPRERGPDVPWLGIVTAASLGWAFIILVIGLCADRRDLQHVEPEPVVPTVPVAASIPPPPAVAAPIAAEPSQPDPEAAVETPTLPMREVPIAPPVESTLLLEYQLDLKPAAPAQVAPPAVVEVPRKFRKDVDLKVYANCAKIGSNVLFVKNPPDAFQKAGAEKKLVFFVHLSGNLEDPGFT